MPLARIFTRYPERAAALSAQLQQQGYRVEVSSPDQAHLPPADLEIEFEICDRADVLQRAAHLAEELQADVAVAPGVLQPEPQAVAEPLPAASVAAEQPVEAAAESLAEVLPMEAAVQAPTEVVPAELAVSTPEAMATEASDREREFEAAFLPVHAQNGLERQPAARADLSAEEQPSPEIEIPEAAALPPVAMMEEEPSAMRAEPILAETAKPATPVPYLSQLTPFGKPADLAQMEAPEYRTVHEPHELPKEAAGTKPPLEGVGRNVANIFSTAMNGLKLASASAAESFRGRVQEYKKRAQVRSAESHAERVARMLDLEQRKAEAQQRATELEAAREAASTRLAELIRERQPGLSEEERKPAPIPEPAPYMKPVDSLRHASIARMQTRPRRPMNPQLRSVLTGAAAVTLIFVIGIVLGEFYPRTPLASPANQASNGVTMQTGAQPAQTGGVTVKTSAPAQTSQTKAPQSSPNGVTPALTPGETKPSPRVSQARHLAAQQDEVTVGDDVVVRHFSRPAPTQKPRQAGQQAGLKHFSDMEN